MQHEGVPQEVRIPPVVRPRHDAHVLILRLLAPSGVWEAEQGVPRGGMGVGACGGEMGDRVCAKKWPKKIPFIATRFEDHRGA